MANKKPLKRVATDMSVCVCKGGIPDDIRVVVFSSMEWTTIIETTTTTIGNGFLRHFAEPVPNQSNLLSIPC